MPGPPSSPPGWYPDGDGNQRWFDGNAWTDHVQGEQTPPPGDSTVVVPDQFPGTAELPQVGGYAQPPSQPPSQPPYGAVPPAWQQPGPPQGPSGSGRGLVIGLAVGGVLLLLAIIVVGGILLLGSDDDKSDRDSGKDESTDSSSEAPTQETSTAPVPSPSTPDLPTDLPSFPTEFPTDFPTDFPSFLTDFPTDPAELESLLSEYLEQVNP